ncbi:proline-rich transmembrane protein 3 isoform X1 [Harpia harpyja]|uniref:proline-rich transmembrane protein 3 isoform X1 n=1 Tax=Harpia harpyja TaxID=202280 RepID=UPI0022B20295|nr:proline-rich transmembrane protein 3 isoform X1 [Harpia harpyja]XP_052633574.1 proline-rich transmembrane protein 3 isoform X1 [Harpia harpyja]
MATARLITWGLLLATGVPAGARGTLSAGLSPGGTLQRDRDPLHSPAWGQQRPGPSPAWEASGEPSGAGVPGSERWGGGSLVRWSPPLQAGDATGASLETETTVAGAGTGSWWNGGAAPAVAEEPLVAWQRHEAEGQDSPWGGTWLPHGSALGTPGPEMPTDTGPGSPGLPWAGQSAAGPAGTLSPRPTVSTIALTPMLAVGTGTGTADTHAGGQPVLGGSTAALGTQLAPANSQPVPLGTVPVPHPTSTGPAQGPHASPSSAQPVGRQGDLGGTPSPSLALPSSAPQLPPTAPSWGLAEPWTRVLPAHQRSTRRAPLSHAAASPGDAAPRTDPGPTGQQGPRPAPGSALSTSPAPPPASSMAPPQHRAAARGGCRLPTAGPGRCGPHERPKRHRGLLTADSASCHRDAWDQALRCPRDAAPRPRHHGPLCHVAAGGGDATASPPAAIHAAAAAQPPPPGTGGQRDGTALGRAATPAGLCLGGPRLWGGRHLSAAGAGLPGRAGGGGCPPSPPSAPRFRGPWAAAGRLPAAGNLPAAGPLRGLGPPAPPGPAAAQHRPLPSVARRLRPPAPAAPAPGPAPAAAGSAPGAAGAGGCRCPAERGAGGRRPAPAPAGPCDRSGAAGAGLRGRGPAAAGGALGVLAGAAGTPGGTGGWRGAGAAAGGPGAAGGGGGGAAGLRAAALQRFVAAGGPGPPRALLPARLGSTALAAGRRAGHGAGTAGGRRRAAVLPVSSPEPCQPLLLGQSAAVLLRRPQSRGARVPQQLLRLGQRRHRRHRRHRPGAGTRQRHLQEPHSQPGRAAAPAGAQGQQRGLGGCRRHRQDAGAQPQVPQRGGCPLLRRLRAGLVPLAGRAGLPPAVPHRPAPQHRPGALPPAPPARRPLRPTPPWFRRLAA